MASEWPLRQLGELTEILDSLRVPVKESERLAGPFPYYGASGIVDHIDAFIFEGLHLLVAEDGENLRTRKTPIAFLADGRFWVNNHAHILRSKAHADIRFLSYAIEGIDVSGFLTGSTIPKLTQGNLRRLLVPAPPLEKQRTIAVILGALDDKIQLNNQMNETLEAMAQALFKSWFIDFDPVRAKMAGRVPVSMDAATAALVTAGFENTGDGAIPRGWRRGALEELQEDSQPNAITAGPFGSKLVRADYVERGIPVIRGGNLSAAPGEWFSEDDFVYVSQDKVARDLSSCVARRGDVLFTQRGTLGQVGMIPLDAEHPEHVVSQSQMKMTCAEWVPPEYIVLTFKQPEVLAYIQANAIAVGVPHINLAFLRRFPILVPPREILRAFGQVIRPLQLRMRANVVENETLAKLRDTLLPKLLSGELRIRDAEREVEKVA